MKGTYILVIFVPEEVIIRIGSLGRIIFKEGYYLYVGSAMGKSGSSTLINRVKRHVKKKELKKVHWHVDYFLNNEMVNMIKIYLIPSQKKLECLIAQELLEISDGCIMNFGSSDCYCKSHLIYFKNIP